MLYDTETHASCRPASTFSSRFVSAVACHVGRVLKAHDDRRGARELYKWSTEDLKDIGISRADAEFLANKPFWRE